MMMSQTIIPANKGLSPRSSSMRKHESDGDLCFHCSGCFDARESKIVFNGSQYHKRCFVCAQCLEELQVDLVFQNENRMYCLHDYKMLFAPSCHGCNQFILQGRVVKAMEHSWHATCFVCSHCGECLANSSTFKKYENNPFCQKCFNKVKVDLPGVYICHKCKGAIDSQAYLKFEGEFYHPYHFKCKTCQNELDPNFREKDGDFFCLRCFDKMGIPICCACKRPVEERVVYALGKAYHVEHFVCSFCNKPFLGTRYFVDKREVYCELHFQMMARKLCQYCHKDVGKESVEFLGKVYCLDHFRCFACDSLLHDTSKIYKVDRKPICKTCLQRLPQHLRRRIAGLHKADV